MRHLCIVCKKFVNSRQEALLLEGWHHGLNKRAAGRCGLPLYMLVDLLHKEARLVSLQIRLVSERKLKRMQRATYRQMQNRLFDMWEA